MIRAYQFNGHRAANLDPLGLHTTSSFPHRPKHAKDLDIEWHGFTEKDLDRKLVLKGRSTGGMTGYLEELASAPEVTLRQVRDTLKATYCNTLGVEYMHIADPEKCNWIREKVENPAWQKVRMGRKADVPQRFKY